MNKDNKKKEDKEEKDNKKSPFDMFRERDETMDDFFRRIFGNPFNNTENPDDDVMKKNSVSYSYRFGAGMDKPDIRVNGKPIDPKDIENMMKELFPEGLSNMFGRGIPNMTGSPKMPKIPVLDASQINLPEENNIVHAPEVEEPYYDIYENDDEKIVEITLELPSVEKERININYLGDAVLISGETNDNRLFQKRFDLKINPKSGKTEIDGRNGIYQIILKE